MINHPLYKTALNYGAISGIASFLFFLGLYYSGINPLAPGGYYGFWIPIIFMILSTRHLRDYELGGSIDYWKAFRVGFFTAASSGLLLALLIYIFGSVIDTQLLEHFKSDSLNYLEQVEETEHISSTGFGKAIYEASLESVEKSTLATISSQEFFNKLIGGLFAAFITAAVLRKSQTVKQS
jgi:hypothetical protein